MKPIFKVFLVAVLSVAVAVVNGQSVYYFHRPNQPSIYYRQNLFYPNEERDFLEGRYEKKEATNYQPYRVQQFPFFDDFQVVNPYLNHPPRPIPKPSSNFQRFPNSRPPPPPPSQASSNLQAGPVPTPSINNYQTRTPINIEEIDMTTTIRPYQSQSQPQSQQLRARPFYFPQQHELLQHELPFVSSPQDFSYRQRQPPPQPPPPPPPQRLTFQQQLEQLQQQPIQRPVQHNRPTNTRPPPPQIISNNNGGINSADLTANLQPFGYFYSLGGNTGDPFKSTVMFTMGSTDPKIPNELPDYLKESFFQDLSFTPAGKAYKNANQKIVTPEKVQIKPQSESNEEKVVFRGNSIFQSTTLSPSSTPTPTVSSSTLSPINAFSANYVKNPSEEIKTERRKVIKTRRRKINPNNPAGQQQVPFTEGRRVRLTPTARKAPQTQRHIEIIKAIDREENNTDIRIVEEDFKKLRAGPLISSNNNDEKNEESHPKEIKVIVTSHSVKVDPIDFDFTPIEEVEAQTTEIPTSTTTAVTSTVRPLRRKKLRRKFKDGVKRVRINRNREGATDAEGNPLVVSEILPENERNSTKKEHYRRRRIFIRKNPVAEKTTEDVETAASTNFESGKESSLIKNIENEEDKKDEIAIVSTADVSKAEE